LIPFARYQEYPEKNRTAIDTEASEHPGRYTFMAQPKAARITCSQCNGWYESEHELWEHMRTVHRRFISEPSIFQHHGTKEEWAKLSIQLKNRVQVHFNPEELEVIDRFILLASQGPVFDDVCR